MRTIELLKPLPIVRDEETHKYLNTETNEWLAYSTTGVCNELTEEAKENIEAYRYIWHFLAAKYSFQNLVGVPHFTPAFINTLYQLLWA